MSVRNWKTYHRYEAFPPNFSAARMAPNPNKDSNTVTSVSAPVNSEMFATLGTKITVIQDTGRIGLSAR